MPKKISVTSGMTGMPNTAVCRAGSAILVMVKVGNESAEMGFKGDNGILTSMCKEYLEPAIQSF
jgi:hypothetical protein